MKQHKNMEDLEITITTNVKKMSCREKDYQIRLKKE